VLDDGIPLKFRIEPIDPYDPFRGRYVRIDFADDKLKLDDINAYDLDDQELYISFGTDSLGYAIPQGYNQEKPVDEVYIKSKVRAIDSSRVRIYYPLKRYYMNEYKAPEADRIMADINEFPRRKAWIIVKVKEEVSVIESLFIDGQKIEDLTQESIDHKEAEK
jgi:hypothetical protein